MDIDKELDDLLDDPLLNDITAKEVELFSLTPEMKHVIEKKQAEYVAQRKPCDDFYRYAEGFKRVHSELKAGQRSLLRVTKTEGLQEGRYYIVSGQLMLLEKILESYGERQRNGRAPEAFVEINGFYVHLKVYPFGVMVFGR